MRQWWTYFFLSGNFLVWTAALILIASLALPEDVGDLLFVFVLLIGAGTLIGWASLRFLRQSFVWGIRRALIDLFTLPFIILAVICITWLITAGFSWLFGDGDSLSFALDVLSELLLLAQELVSQTLFWIGIGLGFLIHFFSYFRRQRFERSSDFLTAKQQLRQFLNYYLKAWRLRSAKELPFQHEWSANPSDVGKPRDDEVRPYLDLFSYQRKWWRRITNRIRRKD